MSVLLATIVAHYTKENKMDSSTTCLLCAKSIASDANEIEIFEICDVCIIEMTQVIELMDEFMKVDETTNEYIPGPDEEEMEKEYDSPILGYELDLYEHFDIPCDLPEWQQEALLEATIGSS
jgi:hypothetical protein